MGASAWTQPGREFVVKLSEMSFFAGDFLAGVRPQLSSVFLPFANLHIVLQHLLLFFLAIPCLIPGFSTLHGVALLWLRPSRQIRSPIFSVKQKSYRRKIIAKYGLLFALIAAIFVALIAAPIILHDTVTLALDGVNL